MTDLQLTTIQTIMTKFSTSEKQFKFKLRILYPKEKLWKMFLCKFWITSLRYTNCDIQTSGLNDKYFFNVNFSWLKHGNVDKDITKWPNSMKNIVRPGAWIISC